MFKRQKNISSSSNENSDNPFLLSYSDIMAGLLIVFILALILFMIQLQKREVDLERTKIDLIEKEKRLEQTLAYLNKLKKQIILSREQLEEKLKRLQGGTQRVQTELDSIGKQRGDLSLILDGIKDELAKQNIEVEVAENKTVLRIPEKSLSFDSGEHEIPLRYHEDTKKIGEVLLKVLQQKENIEILDTVFIEGHTDGVAFRRGEKGNWGLSTYRAISLWQFWTESPGNVKELKDLKTEERLVKRNDAQKGLGDLKPLLQQIEPKKKPLFSVSGYSDLRPSGEKQNPPEGRDLRPGENSKDRRIDIRFTLAPSDEKDLTDVKDILLKQQKELDDLIKSLSKQMEKVEEVGFGGGLNMIEELDMEVNLDF